MSDESNHPDDRPGNLHNNFFLSYFGAPRAMMTLMAEIEDEALPEDIALRAQLAALKHVPRKDFHDVGFPLLARLFARLPDVVIRSIFQQSSCHFASRKCDQTKTYTACCIIFSRSIPRSTGTTSAGWSASMRRK